MVILANVIFEKVHGIIIDFWKYMNIFLSTETDGEQTVVNGTTATSNVMYGLSSSTKQSIHFFPFKTPASEFLLPLRNAQQTKWASLPPSYASWYRNIIPNIPLVLWFKNLDIPMQFIKAFSCLRLEQFLTTRFCTFLLLLLVSFT